MTDEPRCEICNGDDNLGYRPIMTGHRQTAICSPCFRVWYEFDLITPEAITNKRRELEAANVG